MRLVRFSFLLWLAAACGVAPLAATNAPQSTALPATATPEPTPEPTATPRPTAEPVPTRDRVALWRADLDRMMSEMDWIHPNLYWRVSQEEFQAAAEQLSEAIPELSDEQIIIELARIVAFADGHSFLPLFQEAVDFRLYPLRMYMFSDGLYVVSADEPHGDLAGARVVEIGQMTVEEAYAAVLPLVPHDNEMTQKLLAPVYLNVPEVLLALGIIDEAAEPGFVLELPDGTQTTVNLAPISSEPYRDWLSTHLVLAGLPGGGEALYLSRKNDDYFWFAHLEDTNTLYIQYNLVWDTSHWTDGQTIQAFAEEVDAFATEHEVERTIVDVRHNLGGNNSAPLEEVLANNPYINQPGRLYVLTGRQTFSAAIRFLVNVENSTEAIFVGEPTGGPPNFFATQYTSVLWNSRVNVLISQSYWKNSTPDDTRPWIEPHLPVELSSADYFAGRDPVLEAALGADE